MPSARPRRQAARGIPALAGQLAGITHEHPVMRHANNLESVLPHEGTNEGHQLVIGQALTRESAFRWPGSPVVAVLAAYVRRWNR